MATGIADIDKQHHYLLDTLQSASENPLMQNDNVQLKQITKNLLNYAIMHFETEEALMQRYGYKAAYPQEAHSHISQHRDFSRQVIAMRDQLREGETVSRNRVLNFLKHWLYEHVLGIDQMLGEFLNQRIKEQKIDSHH